MGNATSSGDEATTGRRRSSYKTDRAERRTHSHSPRPSQTSDLDLSPAQVHQIQKMWTAVTRTKGHASTGSTIFQGIFDRSAKAKKLFEHQASQGYQMHFVKFSEALDWVIKNLDKTDELSKFLHQLGAKHADLRLGGYEFDPKLWNIFGESMIKCTLDWGTRQQRNKLVQNAWSTLVLFIIDRMKDGYYSQLRQRTRSVASPNHLTIGANNSLRPDDQLEALRRHSAIS